jgi:antitoxin YefM
MEAVTSSDLRANLKQVLDRVVDDCNPVIVTRQRGKPVVIVSLDDWNSMHETLHLLSTPNNAKRLLKSIAQIEAGLVVEREWIEPCKPTG